MTLETDPQEQLPLQHEPLRPVRPDVLGEVAYMRIWGEWMGRWAGEASDYDLPLQAILRRSVVTQRQASVAASFIRWLGTNIGRSFVEEAERMATQAPFHLPYRREDAFLCEWAIQNKLGCMYAPLLSTELNSVVLCAGASVLAPGAVPELTLDDCWVIELLVLWLGSEEGARFIASASAELQSAVRHEEVLR